MRITPLAVFCHKLTNEEIFECVKAEQGLTHSNEVAYYGAAAYCIAISKLL